MKIIVASYLFVMFTLGATIISISLKNKTVTTLMVIFLAVIAAFLAAFAIYIPISAR